MRVVVWIILKVFVGLYCLSDQDHNSDISNRKLLQETISYNEAGRFNISTQPCDPGQQQSGSCAGVLASNPAHSGLRIESENQCTDISPPGRFDCQWYKQRGACEALDDQYCGITCGKCCLDTPLPGVSCEFVKEHLCDDPEVVQYHYCELSCGVCTLPGEQEVVQHIQQEQPSTSQQQVTLSEAQVIRKFFEKSANIECVQSLTGDDPCVWSKVKCDDSGNVKELNFQYFLSRYPNNENTIPLEISQLKFLEVIQFYDNDFAGTIPSQMSVLTNLKKIDLRSNKITGTIPKELAILPQLEKFDLSVNDITGTIPQEYSTLTQLTSLDLSNNEITGTIPKELSALTKLNILRFIGNDISGTLPKELSNIKSVQFFTASYNKLTGTLPKEYSVWGSSVYNMWFSYNNLQGTVPVQYSVFRKYSVQAFPQNGDLCVSQPAPRQLIDCFDKGILQAGQTKFC